ncbi:MAG: right-handed parallel beta-helix repeat-containing protein [Desulfovibrio sp.]|nr:right-handed parallel beta-helix repeat-containing protein [Desulfovibrio sp.]
MSRYHSPCFLTVLHLHWPATRTGIQRAGMVACILACLAVVSYGWVLAHAADQLAERVIHVAAGAEKGDGSSQRPLPTINAALKLARAGDTIAIAPGAYVEHVRVHLPNLRFIGSFTAENEPLVRIVAPENSRKPLVEDSHSSLWRGVAFHSDAGPVMELRDFSGSFEHCLFEKGGPTSSLNIYGGSPQFKSCTFAGQPGPGASVNLDSGHKGKGTVSFSYCLFKNMEGSAFLLRGEEDVQIINCLFANCDTILMRYDGVMSSVSAINSVFYLNSRPKLFLQGDSAPKVRLENCLYSPSPGDYMGWQAKALDHQPEIEAVNCITASPRFMGGRHALVNLCVDDTVNAPIWVQLTTLAEKLGLTISLALNIDALTPHYWDIIKGPAAKGFELASHGAVHSSMAARESIRLAWYSPGAQSATLTIDNGKKFVIRVDGKELFSRSLTDAPEITMSDLVRDLQEKGFRASLVDLSHGKIPARLLEPVQNKDIFFERNAPELAMDTDAYLHYMLAESRAIIEEGLKRYQLPQKTCTAFVSPYAETRPAIVEALKDTGYVLSRSRSEKVLVSARERVRLSFIESISLKNLFTNMPTDNMEEMFRMFLDYLKYHGIIMGLYAHGTDEATVEEWRELMEVLAHEPVIQTLSLAEIAEQVREFCTPLADGSYQCPSQTGPVRGEVSFKPGQGSPLLEAGRHTGQVSNFWGQPLPVNAMPNIGLY